MVETTSRSRSRALLRWLLPVIGIALLGLLIAKIGPGKMLAAWRAAPPLPVVAGCLLYAVTVMLRAAKWRLFLRGTPHPVGYRACAQAYTTNAFFANLTPARTGEMLGPVWLSRHGVPLATGAAVVVVDRMIDLLIVLGLFFLAAWNLSRLAPDDSLAFRTAGVAVSVVVGVALVLFTLVLLRLDVAIGLLGRIRWRLAERVAGLLASFRRALTPFRNRRVLAGAGAITLLGWLLDMVSSYVIIRSFVPDLPFLHSATASMFACLAAIVSFIPGGIGIGAASYTAILVLLGYDASLVGSGAVLWTVLSHVVRGGLAGVNYRRG